MLNTTRGGVDTEKDCDGNYGKNNEVHWLKRYSDSKTSEIYNHTVWRGLKGLDQILESIHSGSWWFQNI